MVEELVVEDKVVEEVTTEEEDMTKTKVFLKKLKDFFIVDEPVEPEVKIETIERNKYDELASQFDSIKKEKEDLSIKLDEFKKLKEELEERITKKESISKKKDEVRDKSVKSTGDINSKEYDSDDGKKTFYKEVIKGGMSAMVEFKKNNPELAEKLIKEFNTNPKSFM